MLKPGLFRVCNIRGALAWGHCCSSIERTSIGEPARQRYDDKTGNKQKAKWCETRTPTNCRTRRDAMCSKLLKPQMLLKSVSTKKLTEKSKLYKSSKANAEIVFVDQHISNTNHTTLRKCRSFRINSIQLSCFRHEVYSNCTRNNQTLLYDAKI